MRSSLRTCLVVLGTVALCLGVTGCSKKHGASIVALGDSVPSGSHCDCVPYPQLTAADLATATKRPATAHNDAVSGATTATVLRQVRRDGGVVGHLRAADAVEIEIGANDVSFRPRCGTVVACYASHLPALRRNLAAIVARVQRLTAGRKVVLVLLDYWNVWLGGRYAAAKGAAYVAAAEEMTDRVNSIILAEAVSAHARYVDLRAAFKGPDYAFDETHLLASDGDHPNAAGHRRIARAVEAVTAGAVP